MNARRFRLAALSAMLCTLIVAAAGGAPAGASVNRCSSGGVDPLRTPRSSALLIYPYSDGSGLTRICHRASGRQTSLGIGTSDLRLAGRFVLAQTQKQNDTLHCSKYMNCEPGAGQPYPVLVRVDAATGQSDSFRVSAATPQPTIGPDDKIDFGDPSPAVLAVGLTGAIAWVDDRGVQLLDGPVGAARSVRKVAATAVRLRFEGRTLLIDTAGGKRHTVRVSDGKPPPPLRPQRCAPPLNAGVILNERSWQVWRRGARLTVCDLSTGRTRTILAENFEGETDEQYGSPLGETTSARAAGHHLVLRYVDPVSASDRLLHFASGRKPIQLPDNVGETIAGPDRSYAVNSCGDVARIASPESIVLHLASGGPRRIIRRSKTARADVVWFVGRRLLSGGRQVAVATGRCARSPVRRERRSSTTAARSRVAR